MIYGPSAFAIKKKAQFVIFSAEQEFTNSCIENSMSKVEVWGLLDAKGSLIAIMLSAHRWGSRKERNGFVKAKAKQVIVYKYLQDFFALKPFRDYCLCSVNIFSRRSYSTKIDIRNQSILSILINLIRRLILIDIRNR